MVSDGDSWSNNMNNALQFFRAQLGAVVETLSIGSATGKPPYCDKTGGCRLAVRAPSNFVEGGGAPVSFCDLNDSRNMDSQGRTRVKFRRICFCESTAEPLPDAPEDGLGAGICGLGFPWAMEWNGATCVPAKPPPPAPPPPTPPPPLYSAVTMSGTVQAALFDEWYLRSTFASLLGISAAHVALSATPASLPQVMPLLIITMANTAEAGPLSTSAQEAAEALRSNFTQIDGVSDVMCLTHAPPPSAPPASPAINLTEVSSLEAKVASLEAQVAALTSQAWDRAYEEGCEAAGGTYDESDKTCTPAADACPPQSPPPLPPPPMPPPPTTCTMCAHPSCGCDLLGTWWCTLDHHCYQLNADGVCDDWKVSCSSATLSP